MRPVVLSTFPAAPSDWNSSVASPHSNRPLRARLGGDFTGTEHVAPASGVIICGPHADISTSTSTAIAVSLMARVCALSNAN